MVTTYVAINQPLPTMADNGCMNPEQAGKAYADEVYAELWMGVLRAAAGERYDPFPDDVVPLAAVYFRCFPPRAKA